MKITIKAKPKISTTKINFVKESNIFNNNKLNYIEESLNQEIEDIVYNTQELTLNQINSKYPIIKV
jgi:hypothetical protein